MRRVSVIVAFSSLLLALSACAPEGPSGYVSFNLPPDSSCVVSPALGTGSLFLPVGQYDISEGGFDGSTACNSSYYVNLLINSNLRTNAKAATGRAEPNYLQIHSAEIHLMNLEKATIRFDRDKKNVLPNPFTVVTANTIPPSEGGTPTKGIAAVEAIPSNYAKQLDTFVGQKIFAEITVFGTTLGDVDIDFKPFVYPIELCDGCLTLCLTQDILDKELDLETVYGNECRDNAGADGRVCVDPDC